MMRIWQKRIIGAVCVGLLLAVSHTGWADPQDDQRAAYEKKAQDNLDKLNATKSRITSISEEKRAIDEETDKATAEYNDIQSKLDDTQARIDTNQARISELEQDYKVKGELLGKRVRDIYINGQISYIDVLFGAKDFQDLMTRMDLLKRIIKQDYDLVAVVLDEKKDIEASQAALEKDKQAKEPQAKEAAEKKDKMLSKQRVRKQLLDSLNSDRAMFERAYDENMAASKQVARMIQSQQGGYAYAGGGSGSMIWPISGPITSDFGWRVHPITGDKRFHSGIDIGGDYGMSVHAAASGTVTYAGWISGYGNAVIIDHGSGISTLYGHNQALDVSVGQDVSQGQTIAECGSTGNSTGPHCHFEVRQNGEPVNPLSYL